MFPNLCQNPFMKIWSPFKMMQDLEVIKKLTLTSKIDSRSGKLIKC